VKDLIGPGIRLVVVMLLALNSALSAAETPIAPVMARAVSPVIPDQTGRSAILTYTTGKSTVMAVSTSAWPALMEIATETRIREDTLLHT
jgi:hypothetical protein